MRSFLILLSLSFFVFSSVSEGADFEAGDSSPRALEFNSEASWSDMHNLARSRAEWFQKTISDLTNPHIPLEEKVISATKICPELCELEIPAPKGLSKETKLRIKQEKILKTVLSDLLYSQLYWNFLERTLEFYYSPENSLSTIRQAVLPHLSRELINFDYYARDELPKKYKYCLEEYFINRAIFKECEALADHWGLAIDQPVEMTRPGTKEPVRLDTESDLKGFTLIEGESVKASKKEPYFMEQILYFRRTALNSVPDANHPMMQAFQAYTLPDSGPIFITPISSGAKAGPSLTFSEMNEPSRKKGRKSSKNKKKGQSSKTATTFEKKIKPNKKETEELLSIEPISQEEQSSTSPRKAPYLEPIVGSSSLSSVVKPECLKDPKTSEIKEKKLEKADHTLPINAPILPFAPRMLNMRDVELHIEHRDSTNYAFQGKVYNFPFAAKSPDCFSIDFLRKIKEMTHLSPKTDKLPNLAQGAITFHYEIGSQQKRKTIKLDELFLSGGKFFGKEDLGFKRDHKIVNAMQDMLPQEERAYIYDLPMEQKGIPLGIAMEKRLRRLVIGGAWKDNCVDSEAILILKLLQKLPNILKYDLMNGAREPITLKHAVLSILSYRDCCPKCSELIQGFQGQLPYLIYELNIPRLSIAADFGTLAIVKGHVPLNGKYPQKMAALTKGIISVESGSHTLVCVSSQQS